MTNSIISVSDLLRTIKTTLELNENLRVFWVKGEISNFTAHRSGHWYFSLKDESSKISCVMFQGYAKEVNFIPKEGDQILLRASISVYPAQGSVQCSVFAMQNLGIGNLYLAYEKLKQKLSSEGLFDATRKKVLPLYPKRIAIVTGRNTAALQDILKTFHGRWPMMDLVIFEALVQGSEAPVSILNALKAADQSQSDCIILARGGGSIEDLWAFNDEKLARGMAECNTPIITGIGHESDTTIADLVADVRAATPTAAVQVATRDYHELMGELFQIKERLRLAIEYQLQSQRQRVDHLSSRFSPTEILRWVQERSSRLTILKHRLSQQDQRLAQYRTQWMHITHELKQWLTLKQLSLTTSLSTYEKSLNLSIERILSQRKTQFSSILALLNAYSPLQRLEAGYTLTYQSDQLIKSINDLDADKDLTVRFKDGQAITQILRKESL